MPAPDTGDLTISLATFTCLAIETATDQASVALVAGGRTFVRESRGLRAPSRNVYEWIGELLAEARIGLGALDCVAYGTGPGSFTGTRVAVAVAQGLGFARGLPLCPVSTLAALAEGAFRTSSANAVACCLDAHMGEVYLGAYQRDADRGVMSLMADTLAAPGAVELPGGHAFVAVGPGWLAYPDALARLGGAMTALDADRLPSAFDVASLAARSFPAGHHVAPSAARPNYLRQRVATVSGSAPAGKVEA